ncbi:2-hydroxyacid dehydrogenase [Mycolicibacterium bacteremicum]|uniref:Hydroxyacid dehydrogenase n=1 Tax=Mycolicibacterium bacteremicum TaxID=564198 RepID=A0A1W9YXL5_MYCBA|nr:2-hydroxyacid dehydrogenase [Mycolicibacterium bacteremicum]MCV7435501.1 hydroxyacid dehydrogenase [Mycolicibacterium bacteremicum]ORA04692.1 hydroxyacid dehydrogenase [Mycolicibacterium bacteremicum]
MKVYVADRNLVPHRDRFEAAVPAGVELLWAGADRSIERLRDASVHVGGRFTAEMAAVAEKLQLVHVAGAGTDRVAFDALGPDVLVANTFHHERSIAEYVLAAAIMLRRRFLAQDAALRRDVWASAVYDDTIAQPPTLGDARIGFVGFGHIGQQSWKLLRQLGCRGAAVTGSGRVTGDHGLDRVDDVSRLDELADASDVLVVSAPLTPGTTGMIGRTQLTALGSDGVLINVGRGPLVDQQALYDALLTGRVGAAAIDVWYRYPEATGRGAAGAPADLPFHELPNLLMTPHSSGITTDTFRGRVDDIAANIGRLVRGEPLHNVVAR